MVGAALSHWAQLTYSTSRSATSLWRREAVQALVRQQRGYCVGARITTKYRHLKTSEHCSCSNNGGCPRPGFSGTEPHADQVCSNCSHSCHVAFSLRLKQALRRGWLQTARSSQQGLRPAWHSAALGAGPEQPATLSGFPPPRHSPAVTWPSHTSVPDRTLSP